MFLGRDVESFGPEIRVARQPDKATTTKRKQAIGRAVYFPKVKYMIGR
jgi:hypothetical protein